MVVMVYGGAPWVLPLNKEKEGEKRKERKRGAMVALR